MIHRRHHKSAFIGDISISSFHLQTVEVVLKPQLRSNAMLKRIAHREESICQLEAVRDYIREHETHMDFMYGPFLKDMQRLKVHGRCLEVGAGPGLFSCMFAGLFTDVTITVTDVSPVMMATAKNLFQEKGLADRTEFCICNVEDADVLKRLGKFDFVFSIYSMHHWQNLKKCTRNLLGCVAENGILYLGDLKRVWWLYCLPTRNRDIRQIRAAYLPHELKRMLRELDVNHYEIRTLFPFFLMSVVTRAAKQGVTS
jgi:predicted O-methyltransferase YrrM